MKGPQRREQRPPFTNRQIAIGGMIAVLFFAVLFTMVALASHDTTGGGSVVPDSGPGVEVDVDVRHPRPAHSTQRVRSEQPGVGKVPATPNRTTATKGAR